MVEIRLEEDDDGRKKFTRMKKDGSREEIRSEPLSDDPEVTAVSKLPHPELRAILEDPKHPQYRAAKEYNLLLGERLRATLSSSLRGFGTALDGINSDLSSLDLDDHVSPDPGHKTSGLYEPIQTPDLSGLITRSPIYDVVDGQKDLVERMAKTNEILALLLEQGRLDAAEQQGLLRQQIDAARIDSAEQQSLLRQQLDEARADAEDQMDRAEFEHARGIEAWWVAWVAVIVTALVGLGQLALGVVGILPHLSAG